MATFPRSKAVLQETSTRGLSSYSYGSIACKDCTSREKGRDKIKKITKQSFHFNQILSWGLRNFLLLCACLFVFFFISISICLYTCDLQLTLQAVLPKHHGKHHTFYFSDRTVISWRRNKLVFMKVSIWGQAGSHTSLPCCQHQIKKKKSKPFCRVRRNSGVILKFMIGHKSTFSLLLLGTAYNGCSSTFRHSSGWSPQSGHG